MDLFFSGWGLTGVEEEKKEQRLSGWERIKSGDYASVMEVD